MAENSNIELKKFEDYLKNNPPNGSTAPPRTVPAKTLDKNFKKVTLIRDPEPDQDNDRSYTLDYKDEGTVLKLKRFPRGKNKSDLCYWNPEAGEKNGGAWVVLSAVESEDVHVLTLKNKELAFTKPPRGNNTGDILYWDPNSGDGGTGEWVVFPAIEADELHLLGISGGSLSWVPTADCEEDEE
jgi:hypothetical protein